MNNKVAKYEECGIINTKIRNDVVTRKPSKKERRLLMIAIYGKREK